MLTGFMITRPNGLLAVLAAGAFSLLVSACEKVPLMAPAGSTIILTASTNALPVNATTDIIAQVLEAAGTPPHSGTLVTFTTTLGAMQPAEARTDVGGRVVVRFRRRDGQWFGSHYRNVGWRDDRHERGAEDRGGNRCGRSSQRKREPRDGPGQRRVDHDHRQRLRHQRQHAAVGAGLVHDHGWQRCRRRSSTPTRTVQRRPR